MTFFIERKFESLSVEVLLLAHEAHLQKFQKHGFSNSLTINYTQTNLNFSLAYGFDGYNVLNKALQPNSENFSSNSRGGFGPVKVRINKILDIRQGILSLISLYI